jgi:hypothetical protein
MKGILPLACLLLVRPALGSDDPCFDGATARGLEGSWRPVAVRQAGEEWAPPGRQLLTLKGGAFRWEGVVEGE